MKITKDITPMFEPVFFMSSSRLPWYKSGWWWRNTLTVSCVIIYLCSCWQVGVSATKQMIEAKPIFSATAKSVNVADSEILGMGRGPALAPVLSDSQKTPVTVESKQGRKH